ncbi:MAG: hypothetical protein KJ063_25015 [Anaerolineae bacterium]|nr:hypothetical protein [Anaerolineae bacterium]
MKRVLFCLLFLTLLPLLFIGCDPTHDGPDLIPQRRSGSQGDEGFCRRDEDGNLVVRVQNQGNEDVFENFTTIVQFSPEGPQSATTAPMPSGSFTEVVFVIPSGCFNSDCDFAITVDANGDIDEGIEDNNMADGICIG